MSTILPRIPRHSRIDSVDKHAALVIGSAVGLSLGAIGVVGYSHWIEPYWLEVTYPVATLPNLPRALDGVVVAHLSDFHLYRSTRSNSAVAQAIAACNAAEPDVVVMTGDYLGERHAVPRLAAELSKLKTRPAYAVLGNHDYRFGPKTRRSIECCFADLGVELLDNRAAAFERRGAKLWFLGVGDGYTSHDRLSDALAGLGDDDRPRILLSHYPDLLLDLPTNQIDLALSGHSHGAQIHLPLVTRLALRHSETRFDRGFHLVRGAPLYVNRGLGTSGRQLRLFARPELTLFTLRCGCRQDSPLFP